MWLLHLSVLRLSGAAWWDMTNATGTQSDMQQTRNRQTQQSGTQSAQLGNKLDELSLGLIERRVDQAKRIRE